MKRTVYFAAVIATMATNATIATNTSFTISRAALGAIDAGAPASVTGRRETSAPLPLLALSPDAAGIGFDDLGFARQLRKVLVPAGGSGRIDLVDPDSFAVTSVMSTTGGIATPYAGGHGDGITSADSDGARIFAIDRTSKHLLVVNPTNGALLRSASLSGHPDYVRWVAATRELWIAEPQEERIEIFSIESSNALRAAGSLSVVGGPESLVIDEKTQRAFTHLWKGVTVAIDIRHRSILARWPNGCRVSRGIAYDSDDGIVLVACSEGKLIALDANHDGRKRGSIATGGGVDVIAFSSALRHAYVPSADEAVMTVVGVAREGKLRKLEVVPTAKGAHCVTADDRAHAWVCDPIHGGLLRFTDAQP